MGGHPEVNSMPQRENKKGEMRIMLTVLIGLIVAVSGVLLLGWLLWQLWARDEEEVSPVVEIEIPEAPPAEPPVEVVEEDQDAVPSVRAEAPPAPEEGDDLKVIEGIGPKISQVLREAGVATFGELASLDADGIQAILTAADPRLGRLADPSTWPAQAALAADGDWEALSNFQAELKGGQKA